MDFEFAFWLSSLMFCFVLFLFCFVFFVLFCFLFFVFVCLFCLFCLVVFFLFVRIYLKLNILNKNPIVWKKIDTLTSSTLSILWQEHILCFSENLLPTMSVCFFSTPPDQTKVQGNKNGTTKKKKKERKKENLLPTVTSCEPLILNMVINKR